jgi:peptide/nickel transport system ATP-binding protein
VVLDIREATIEYRGRGRRAHHRAVDHVTLSLAAGEFVAIVGESGSGKTSLASAIFGLARLTSGEIHLGGERIDDLSGGAARRLRRGAQLVLQDPYDALDPDMSVAQLVAEPLVIYGIAARDPIARTALVDHALGAVGLTPVAEFRVRRPHELSGGQRQRVSIAAALVVEPSLLVADEPVSMLDVSVRAGVLDVLDRRRVEHGTAILMITHDLPTAAAYCDRIVVMKDGRIVEQGPAQRLVAAPQHDYTRELLTVMPRLRDQPTRGVARIP